MMSYGEGEGPAVHIAGVKTGNDEIRVRSKS